MAESLRTLLGQDLATALLHNGDVLNERAPGLKRRLNVALTPCMIAALLHRLAHRAWQGRWFGLAACLARLNLLLNRLCIHPACRIAGGLYIPHPAGVVLRIHAGRNLVVLAHASVCDDGRGAPDNWPCAGEDVWIAAGARVTGRLMIGDHARVGPGAILCRNLPAGSVVNASPSGVAS